MAIDNFNLWADVDDLVSRKKGRQRDFRSSGTCADWPQRPFKLAALASEPARSVLKVCDDRTAPRQDTRRRHLCITPFVCSIQEPVHCIGKATRFCQHAILGLKEESGAACAAGLSPQIALPPAMQVLGTLKSDAGGREFSNWDFARKALPN